MSETVSAECRIMQISWVPGSWACNSKCLTPIRVQSRFAEMPTLTLTLNPNFGESGFGESGRHQPLTLISANRVSAKWVSANREDTPIRDETVVYSVKMLSISSAVGHLTWYNADSMCSSSHIVVGGWLYCVVARMARCVYGTLQLEPRIRPICSRLACLTVERRYHPVTWTAYCWVTWCGTPLASCLPPAWTIWSTSGCSPVLGSVSLL